jgi:hypothetical protein
MTLAKLREARLRSQAQIAEKLGIKQAAVSRLERRTDMFLVISDKRPGVDQIGRAEYGERGQNLCFCQTKPPIALERPNRDSRSRDPGITAANASRRLDS